MEDLRRDSIVRSMNARGAAVKGSRGSAEENVNARGAAEENGHVDIFQETATEVIKAGDVLFLSCAQASIVIL